MKTIESAVFAVFTWSKKTWVNEWKRGLVSKETVALHRCVMKH